MRLLWGPHEPKRVSYRKTNGFQRVRGTSRSRPRGTSMTFTVKKQCFERSEVTGDLGLYNTKRGVSKHLGRPPWSRGGHSAPQNRILVRSISQVTPSGGPWNQGGGIRCITHPKGKSDAFSQRHWFVFENLSYLSHPSPQPPPTPIRKMDWIKGPP